MVWHCLERKHKVFIGGLTTLVVIFLLINSAFLYVISLKIDLKYNVLENQVSDFQTDTSMKINELSSNILQTQQSLDQSITALNSSLKTEISKFKASASSDFSGIVEQSISSVLTVRTDVSQGSGFLITEDGYFVTNAHVLLGGTKVFVITSEKDVIEAELIGYSTDFDIALLKMDGDFEKLGIADSNNIQVGEKVIAIGNPLGLQFSVSEGIVSATHREGPNQVPAYVQTDAALNPGNSGGPLINKKGEVVGINNFKVSGSESLGFALESNYLKDIVDQISLQAYNSTLL
jgi:S1-C subfamily serine protease